MSTTFDVYPGKEYILLLQNIGYIK